MDLNQTARETLTRVQAELAQGKDKIEWTIYAPVSNLDGYRRDMKKLHGFRAYIRLIGYAFMLVLGLAKNGLSHFWIGLLVIAFIAWYVWENQKRLKEALMREYFDYKYCVNFKRKKYILFLME